MSLISPKEVYEYYSELYLRIVQAESAVEILRTENEILKGKLNKMITKEELARKMYDKYCESVGGLAFNGDKLPHSDEFFEDESKQKQANAWRDAAAVALSSTDGTDPVPPDPTHKP